MFGDHRPDEKILLEPAFCVRVFFRNENATEFNADPGELLYPYILVAVNILVVDRALIPLSSVNYFIYLDEELYNHEQELKED